MYAIVRKFSESYEDYLRNNNPDITNEKDNPITECVTTYFDALKDFKVIGTPGGLKGFFIKLPIKSHVYMSGYKNKSGKVRIGPNQRKVTFIHVIEDDDDNKDLAYELVFRYERR